MPIALNSAIPKPKRPSVLALTAAAVTASLVEVPRGIAVTRDGQKIGLIAASAPKTHPAQ
ncbi:hypothetical protein AB0I10_09850 [Streptomyces sp. NPDC050636]|uniref:hypothetical protein n=1 Tax=Streptomyces sp. NPDC050636 TaxID=3154510 RepID=UPI00343E68E9